jgi:uncharacterized OsmC-like protein
MTTEAQTQLNEVNLAAVGALVEAIQGDASKAKTTWAAHVTWNGAFTSESKVRGFEPVPSDEPAALGGTDQAPNPVEQLLGALGNCLAVGYAANATVAGIPIDELSIDLKGDIDLKVFLGLAEGHAGFDSITATVHLKSPASPEDLATLHQKVQATSPVGHTLSSSVPLTITTA